MSFKHSPTSCVYVSSKFCYKFTIVEEKCSCCEKKEAKIFVRYVKIHKNNTIIYSCFSERKLREKSWMVYVGVNINRRLCFWALKRNSSIHTSLGFFEPFILFHFFLFLLAFRWWGKLFPFSWFLFLLIFIFYIFWVVGEAKKKYGRWKCLCSNYWFGMNFWRWNFAT